LVVDLPASFPGFFDFFVTSQVVVWDFFHQQVKKPKRKKGKGKMGKGFDRELVVSLFFRSLRMRSTLR